MRLSSVSERISDIRYKLAFDLGLKQDSEKKVFCVGMQRTGTTSFGDFCEQELGLRRRGYNASRRRGWTRAWYDGELETVFQDPVFRSGQIFDDDPWWCPGVADVILNRFFDARLVMFQRDPDAWFRSLCSHSYGRSPGFTDIHARIYGRERELDSLRASGLSVPKVNGLTLEGKETQYKLVLKNYQNHIGSLADKFPERVLVLDLEDTQKFARVAEFLEYPRRHYREFRSNVIASRDEENGKESNQLRDR